ncbi:peptidase S10 [Novosphingobium sp. BL-8A]|uniref:S10 family peptidase n=1 Tax=Novosphingobium sp. BL-8A TaxID=3127639 RepID=UPI0037579EB4
MKKLAAVLLMASALPLVGPVCAAESAALPVPAQVDLSAPIVTAHTGVFNGRKIAYSAVVERFDTSAADGTPAARLVAISYIAKKADKQRPVLFVFNGGPIVSSSTLHMGAFGPKRVSIPEDIHAPATSFKLVDNPNTLLDEADLVFFDPAGTGFSRFAPGTSPATQASNVADSRQLAQMVLQWCKTHDRLGAPIYLVGESYGTMRAPEAAGQLLQAGVAVDGIVLLGQAVNIIEYAQRPANLTSYAVSLQTLAAIAWEQGKADAKGRDFARFMADAKAFAMEEYLPALYLGGSAPEARQREVAAKLAEFTGLGADWYLAHKLRITKAEYLKTLLPGYTLNAYDARYRKPAGGEDPFDLVTKAYEANFAQYLAADLKAGSVGSYLPGYMFPGGLNGWDWGVNKSPFGDWPYKRPISDLMDKNPRFRLMVANGWTDTETTVGAMELLVNEAQWPKDRVKTFAYRGGHMAYTVPASLEAFTRDVRAMIERRW